MTFEAINARSAPARSALMMRRLSDALAAAAFVTGFVTYVFGGLLVGPSVMNGSARGTALSVFVVGAPLLFVAGRRALAGSARAVFVWAGTAMYLAYNGFMFLVATPLNRVFLVYVVMFGLALATMIGIAATTDVVGVARHIAPTLPARPIAVYLWVVVGLNALAWLSRIVPATVGDTTSDLVDGMGIATVPTYLQDLAFWLPLLAVGGWLLWHRRPWGHLVGGAGLAFWTLEAVTVAVDQWFGHRADPASDVVSDALIIPFAALAVIGVGVLWSFLRHVDRRPDEPAH